MGEFYDIHDKLPPENTIVRVKGQWLGCDDIPPEWHNAYREGDVWWDDNGSILMNTTIWCFGAEY